MTTSRIRRQSVRTMVHETTAEPGIVQPTTVPPPIQAEPILQESQTFPLVPTIAVPLSAQAQLVEQVQVASLRPKRDKLGWKIRADLIKQCKQIALDENRHDYEILEELLEMGIEQRRQQREQQET